MFYFSFSPLYHFSELIGNKNVSKKEIGMFQKLISFIYLGDHSRKPLESAHCCQIRPILAPVRL